MDYAEKQVIISNMPRKQPETPVDLERTGFEILDADPLQAETVKAVDQLIELQKCLFAAELADDQQAVGKLYQQMAATEASINNHGEEAALAYDAAQKFIEAGSLEDAIAACTIQAEACFKMSRPDVGYSAFQTAVSVRQQIARETKEKLAAESDTVIIARHTPSPASAIFEGLERDEEAWQLRFMFKMVHENWEAFQAWLQGSGEQAVASVLRVFEESEEAGYAIGSVWGVLSGLTKDYTIPPHTIEQILTDLDDFQDYGPYPFELAAGDRMRQLGKIYHNLTLQPHINGKQRGYAFKESFFLRHAAEAIRVNGNFSSPDSVRQPIREVRSIKDAYRRRHKSRLVGGITHIS